MSYEWDSDLETGHEIIDKQHKEMFAVLNELLDAHRAGRGVKELSKTMEFLTAYVIQHFADEEKLQDMYDYPDKLNHKTYHNEFKHTAKELVQKLENEGYSDALLQNTIRIIADWLVYHIKSDDFRLAAHVQTMLKSEKK
ncbi:MAG: hemerythrin family protein [Endomicrobia bacterium]|nr:hemerythrin family protein [Endomicrobiia bacterium]MCL2144811.1 hemerythrin family protein [Endomicrobiia bacterium]